MNPAVIVKDNKKFSKKSMSDLNNEGRFLQKPNTSKSTGSEGMLLDNGSPVQFDPLSTQIENLKLKIQKLLISNDRQAKELAALRAGDHHEADLERLTSENQLLELQVLKFQGLLDQRVLANPPEEALRFTLQLTNPLNSIEEEQPPDEQVQSLEKKLLEMR